MGTTGSIRSRGKVDLAESIRLYVFAARGLSASEFVRAYPDPVLVLTPFSSADGTGSITRIAHGGGRVSIVPFQVARVKKRPGSNPFKSMITIGRADHNDIQVKAGEISKFHCYLTTGPDGVSITDAGSTNGTTVNGAPLVPKQPHKLAAGDEVALGGVLVAYHDPGTFYEFLRSAVGDGDIDEI